jgi:SSS family solute:Na+ symporter
MGAASFVLDLPVFGSKKLLTDTLGISFLMQAWWMFCICSAIYVVVSLATPPPAPANVDGLTWANPLAAIFGKPLTSARDPRIFAGLLLLTMVVFYSLFR